LAINYVSKHPEMIRAFLQALLSCFDYSISVSTEQKFKHLS